MADTFFPECLICKQGMMSFDGVDISGVCFDEKCQKIKDRIIKNTTSKCENCGVEFLNNHQIDRDTACSTCSVCM